MNRETKSVTTPQGHAIVLHTYITGRDRRALAAIFLNKDVSFDMETENIKGFDASLIDKAQDLAFNTVVVSFDGHKNGDIVDGKTFSVVDAILDLPDADTKFIVNAVNEVTTDKEFEKKKVQ